MGEGVLAVFSEVTAAVRVVLNLADGLAADTETPAVRLKVAIHRGLALVATINDRLDYFGATVKQAGRLLEHARGGELILTAATASDAEVNELLRGSPVQVANVTGPGGERNLALRVTLPRPATSSAAP